MLCLIPFTRIAIHRSFEKVRSASPRAIRWMILLVFSLVGFYLLTLVIWQARPLFPQWHDQQATLIQSQMLARGRLWMPAHPCADFFETFYVLTKGIYAPLYFPGTALFYVPTIWLHLPYWVQPLLCSAALAGLLFRVITELIDPLAGLLAALFLTSLWIFRLLSVWEMSHTVLALLALWAIWSWLRWRESRSIGWAISIGIAIGWAAITRPLDAICYAVPLGFAFLWDLRVAPWTVRLVAPVSVVAAAIPFLCLQLIFNKHVTGHLLETPFEFYYTQVEFTGLRSNGRMPAPDARPTSTLPQKRNFGTAFVLPQEREFASQSFLRRLALRAERTAMCTLPSGAFLLLLPAGLLLLTAARRLALGTPVVLFILGYSFYPLWLDHYALTIASGVILCVLLAARAIASAWPRPSNFADTFLSLGILALLITSLPEFHSSVWDETNSWPAVTFNYETLSHEVKTPALVLYRYWKSWPPDKPPNFNDEPVYNVDVAWPDNAPIIRAHDLGERDVQIIEYYGDYQPQRNVYVVDRNDLKIHSLGTAGDLARRLRTGESILKILPPP